MRVVSRAPLPFPFSFTGVAGRSEDGVVNTSCSCRSSLRFVVVFGLVLDLSFVPACSVGVGAGPFLPLACCPWRMASAGARWVRCSANKSDGVPDLEDQQQLQPTFCRRLGGGDAEEFGRSSRSSRLGPCKSSPVLIGGSGHMLSSSPVNLLAEGRPGYCCSFSSTKTLELRRLLLSSVTGGGRWAVSFLELRRLLLPAGNGGRWAVSSSWMTLLVEGRPFVARLRISSSSRLYVFGEAVLLKFGVQLPFLLEMASWRSGVPKWFVPGDGRDVSLLKQWFGSNCNFNFLFRVLPEKSRDWLLIFCFSDRKSVV